VGWGALLQLLRALYTNTEMPLFLHVTMSRLLKSWERYKDRILRAHTGLVIWWTGNFGGFKIQVSEKMVEFRNTTGQLQNTTVKFQNTSFKMQLFSFTIQLFSFKIPVAKCNCLISQYNRLVSK
jgi:hypothetical protein